ncbi:MAG TPA: hypothetical protein VMB80_00320 [Candidatus Acidoferrum sp.]|nr:hypothetical protein [Candidatus Acidoferrum sp.]
MTKIPTTIPNQTVCTTPKMVAIMMEKAAMRMQAVPILICRRNEAATGKNASRLSFRIFVAQLFTIIADDTNDLGQAPPANDADREAELTAPSGVACTHWLGRFIHRSSKTTP